MGKTRRYNRTREPTQQSAPTIKKLQPLNPTQKVYMNSLRFEEQVVTLGPAGTGKTYIAAATAADMLAAKQIEKIVLTRPAVGVDEEHGFLPGDLGQKLAPWVVPFTDVLEQRLGQGFLTYAMRTGAIDVVPLAYMRGRTFDNSFVILDEAQNTTYKQIKMFLTRIGENCRTVINGDISQTDLADRCGLKIILDMIKGQGLPVRVVEFTSDDIVRSGICAMWAEAFDIYEKN